MNEGIREYEIVEGMLPGVCRGTSGKLHKIYYKYKFDISKYYIEIALIEKNIGRYELSTCGDVLRGTYCEGYFSKNRTASFNIEVAKSMERRGLGTGLLNTVLYIIEQYNSRFQTEIISLNGMLSTVDAKNGNWKISLPFYASFPQRINKDILKSIYSITPQFKLTETNKILDLQEMLAQKGNGQISFAINYV